MKNKYIRLLIIVGLLLVLSLVTSASYAYFVAYVNGNESASANVIETGNMEITFEDGSGMIKLENFIPGSQVTKTFSVKNTGDVYAYYNLYFDETINDFYHTDTLVYELTSDNGLNVSQTPCPVGTDSIGLNIGIDVGQTHNYSLKITFLNTDFNQNVDKATTFQTTVSLVKQHDVHRDVTTMYQTTITNATNATNNEHQYATFFKDDFKTFGKSYNSTNAGVYFKYDTYIHYLYLNDYYKLIMQMDVTDNMSTVEACENSYPSSEMSCYEQNNRIIMEYDRHIYFSSENLCQESISNLGNDSIALISKCVSEHSDEAKRIQYSTDQYKPFSIQLCINNGSELCFDPHQYFDSEVADDYSTTNNKYADEYQQFIDEISSFGTFNCTIFSGIVCSYDDKIVIRYRNGDIIVQSISDSLNEEYVLKTDGSYTHKEMHK